MSKEVKVDGYNLKPSDFTLNNNGKLAIKKNKINGSPGMLLIYANWCGHCVRFKPTFNKIHNKIGTDFTMASIEHGDFEKDSEFIKLLNFRGYPSIKFFDQQGNIIGDYKGDRDESAILNHICKVYHHCMLER